MPTNTRLIKLFLDKTIDKNPQDGLIVNEVARLFNELCSRRASGERAQPASFYPIVEMYCIIKAPEAQMEVIGSERRIRGFSFKSDGFRRLAAIFVRGTGATADNLETINKLFEPLMDLTQGL